MLSKRTPKITAKADVKIKNPMATFQPINVPSNINTRGSINGDEITKDITVPKGTPACNRPRVIGTVEHAQKGVTAPKATAIILPQRPFPDIHFFNFSCGIYMNANA